jgi:ketosteroid isomerase-like protein
VPRWVVPVVAVLAVLLIAVGALAASGMLSGEDPTTTPTREGDNTGGATAVTEDEATQLMDEFETAFEDEDSEAMLNLMTPDAIWTTQGWVDASTPEGMKEAFDEAFSTWNSPTVSPDAGAFTAASGDQPATLKVDLSMYEEGELSHHWVVDVEVVKFNGEPRISALVEA